MKTAAFPRSNGPKVKFKADSPIINESESDSVTSVPHCRLQNVAPQP